MFVKATTEAEWLRDSFVYIYVYVYMYCSLQAGSKTLKEALEKRDLKKIPTDLVNWQDLYLIIIYLSLTVRYMNKNQVQL